MPTKVSRARKKSASPKGSASMAERIAKALEPYNIMYLEDVMLSSNVEAFAHLSRKTSVPICMSETLAGRYQYRAFLEAKACDVVMYDVTWCGGVTEAKKNVE